jgi:NADH-quinone oxidoreductase subunit G
LRDGDYGVRLVESSGGRDWFKNIPEPFKPINGQWRIVLLPHIFGSEELSLHSPPVAERSPIPCATLNSSDAGRLGVQASDRIEIHCLSGGPFIVLPVSIEPALPSGLVGITEGRQETARCCQSDQVILKKAIGEEPL